MTSRARGFIVGSLGAMTVVLAAAVWWKAAVPPTTVSTPTGVTATVTADFVGSQACAACHATESADWQTSQHAGAMAEATSSTVLGRFDGTTFTNAGVTSTFARRGDTFVVRTEGADGRPAEFGVSHTFGVYPLQQVPGVVP